MSTDNSLSNAKATAEKATAESSKGSASATTQKTDGTAQARPTSLTALGCMCTTCRAVNHHWSQCDGICIFCGTSQHKKRACPSQLHRYTSDAREPYDAKALRCAGARMTSEETMADFEEAQAGHLETMLKLAHMNRLVPRPATETGEEPTAGPSNTSGTQSTNAKPSEVVKQEKADAPDNRSPALRLLGVASFKEVFPAFKNANSAEQNTMRKLWNAQLAGEAAWSLDMSYATELNNRKLWPPAGFDDSGNKVASSSDGPPSTGEQETSVEANTTVDVEIGDAEPVSM